MRITHLGHACVLIEIGGGTEAPTRLLFDPGNFTSGLAAAGPVDAVLITHEHVDHLDPDQIRIIRESSPGALMYGGPAAAEVLRSCGVEPIVLTGDSQLDVAGVRIDALYGKHEPVHPELPVPSNIAYLIAESLLHPGDSWMEVPGPVDTLLLPTGGPWMKLGEAVEYARRVRPGVAVPIHQQGLAPEHQALHVGVLSRLVPSGTELVALQLAQPTPV